MRYIIIFFICNALGIKIGSDILSKPTKIEFKISRINCFFYAFVMFFLISMVMDIELEVYHWLKSSFHPIDWRLKLLYRTIDGGILVEIAIVLLSILFGKWLISFNLDMSSYYDIKYIKLYYSLSIVANCIGLLVIAYPKIINDDPEVQSIISRVIIWILNVISTWIGMGFGCEGRIQEEQKNKERSEQVINKKEVWTLYRPFIWAFMLDCFVLAVTILDVKWLDNMFIVFECIIFGGMIGILLSCFKYPSEKRSNRKLSTLIRQMQKNKIRTGYFCMEKYSLLNDGMEKYLLIHEKKVEWIGHEKEIEEAEILKEKKISMEKFDYIICKEILEKTRNERRSFIRDKFEKCDREEKERILNKN